MSSATWISLEKNVDFQIKDTQSILEQNYLSYVSYRQLDLVLPFFFHLQILSKVCLLCQEFCKSECTNVLKYF